MEQKFVDVTVEEGSQEQSNLVTLTPKQVALLKKVISFIKSKSSSEAIGDAVVNVIEGKRLFVMENEYIMIQGDYNGKFFLARIVEGNEETVYLENIQIHDLLSLNNEETLRNKIFPIGV